MSAKRRRLTCSDKKVAIGNEEHVVKIKDWKDSEQKLNYGNPFGANVDAVEVDDLWLKVKKEIKEELERDMRSSVFGDFDHTLRKVVEVKNETDKDIEDHHEPHKTSEVAVKHEVGQRLTGKVQVAAGTEGLSSEKKPSDDAHDDGRDDGVKIKEENVPEDGHAHFHKHEPNKPPNLGSAERNEMYSAIGDTEVTCAFDRGKLQAVASRMWRLQVVSGN